MRTRDGMKVTSALRQSDRASMAHAVPFAVPSFAHFHLLSVRRQNYSQQEEPRMRDLEQAIRERVYDL
jgi:hypothetical protein